MLSRGPAAQPNYGYHSWDGWILRQPRRWSSRQALRCHANYHRSTVANYHRTAVLDRSEMIDLRVVGRVSSPGRIARTLELVAITIADDLWSGLLRPLSETLLWLS